MIVVVLSQPERLIIAGREQQNSVRSTRKRPQRVRLYRGRGVHRKRYRGLSRTCAFYLFIRQPMGRKSALRREILWILRGFQGRLSC